MCPISDWELGAEDRLFDNGKDWRNHAVLSHSASKSQAYALGFQLAANALVGRGLQQREQDLVLFPILYCYRHAIELSMKDVIYLDQRWQGGPYEAIWTHKLTELWARTRTIIERAFPREDATQLDAIERIIGELALVDPDAEQFRYDRDRNGRSRQLPDELMRVDLRHCQRGMGKVYAQLEAVHTGLSEMRDAADW